MLHSAEDIDESNTDSNVEIDDSEVMPELPLEQEVSDNDIRLAMEKFPQNFAKVYPSSGPALYMGPLNEAINHSLLNLIDVSFQLFYITG
ncbi:unnamed protein product [Rotaria sp. Silwood2]|nr:unnamed protein product [Rotaria sp. Silwood2]